jgi:hypothetical protein
LTLSLLFLSLLYSLQSRPLNRGLPPSISAKIQPTDHISTILFNNKVSIMRPLYNKQNARLTSFGIFLETQHDFRGSVPSSSNILCHETSVSFRRRGIATSQTEITDLLYIIIVIIVVVVIITITIVTITFNSQSAFTNRLPFKNIRIMICH